MTKLADQLIEPEIAVIGGGIAGLWLMNRLLAAGYDCVLLEKHALGQEQTLASQGMIHGGMKYALSAKLTGASESVADMPKHWLQCLEGKGDVDLSGADVLSRHFYFWSSDGAASKMSTFFASKSVQGRVDRLAREEFPALLQAPEFSGQVYKLQDIVLDIPSVLRALVNNCGPRLFKLPEDAEWRVNEKQQAELIMSSPAGTVLLRPKQFVLSAGRGNGDILEALGGSKPRMQLRPLHQVWMKHNLPHSFFGHCLGADTTPRLSISTHPTEDGNKVWSLGGSLAEKGVALNQEQVIAKARDELAQLFPWLDFSNNQFIAKRIDRAEARQRNFLRPDKAFAQAVSGITNAIVTWPTKLTLAPNLANEVISLLASPQQSTSDSAKALQMLTPAAIAKPLWDTAFGVHE